ncbi:hypothetical protein ACS0TY_036327 [Phlomoides rotata]
MFFLRRMVACLLRSFGLFGGGRNKLIFRGKGFSVEEILHKAVTHRIQFLETMKVGGRHHKSPTVTEYWRPPTGNRMKLNVDAYVRMGLGASIGGIIRNNSGEVVWCFAQCCEGIFEVDTTEALAA